MLCKSHGSCDYASRSERVAWGRRAWKAQAGECFVVMGGSFLVRNEPSAHSTRYFSLCSPCSLWLASSPRYLSRRRCRFPLDREDQNLATVAHESFDLAHAELGTHTLRGEVWGLHQGGDARER